MDSSNGFELVTFALTTYNLITWSNMITSLQKIETVFSITRNNITHIEYATFFFQILQEKKKKEKMKKSMPHLKGRI